LSAAEGTQPPRQAVSWRSAAVRGAQIVIEQGYVALRYRQRARAVAEQALEGQHVAAQG